MGDLSKLKIAVGQVDIVDGRPSRNGVAIDRMVDAALDGGADILVAQTSFENEENIHLIGLNDSRIDIVGGRVQVDACGDTYEISLGRVSPDCDFSVVALGQPYTLGDSQTQGAYNVPLIALKPVGMRDRGTRLLSYDGGTSVFSRGGRLLLGLRDDFSEDLRTFTFADESQEPAFCRKKLLTALVTTIRRFDDQVLGGQMKWVIGLSGGLDSSIVAALLVLALGSDRVVGYSLASRFNSDATRANAIRLAGMLGIPLRTGSIELMLSSLGTTLAGFGYEREKLVGLTLENAQARTRGSLLSAFAALEGGVVVNNGNRVEASLGYSTLYGDSIGALAPIGDISKVRLFSLARDINDTFGYEIVPANLLPVETEEGYAWETMPSAELSHGQIDPMKWFYHDWLIEKLLDDETFASGNRYAAACEIIEQYLDDRLMSSEVGKWIRFYGLDHPLAFAADIEWVLGCMRSSAFKRLQAAPFIAVASRRSALGDPDPQVEPEPPSRYFALLAKVRRLSR